MIIGSPEQGSSDHAKAAPKWRKLGLLYQPPGSDWMYTHAQNPLPEHISDGVYRVHFATRDRLNRARGAWFVFDIRQPSKILDVSSQPTLDLGELGAFDDAGAMPGSIVHFNSRHYMYYTGWSRTVDVPFAFHIGLCSSEDPAQPYSRVSRAPVLGRNHFDPFITGAPYVIHDNGRLRMWYTSATSWLKPEGNEKAKHYYTVKHAESPDGINWQCSADLCIPYGADDYAIARPVVWKDSDQYTMWFTHRGDKQTYRIGSAVSHDGITWDRSKAGVGIEPSEEGWDSEMICYAHPLFFEGQTFALYNGNSYGVTGIGLAVLEA